MKVLFVISGLFWCSYSQCQYTTFGNTTFTWEGALTGNKAVWNADDIQNTYPNINGEDVKVTMLDPLGLNTTTSRPSEFNDFTKTNTFFGSGSFALQITSTERRQTACLKFEFSKPVILSNFRVFDIDMIQSGANLWSTFQDSLSFTGDNISGNVPLTLTPLSQNPIYTIYGQSVKANYQAGINGDVSHTNPDGAVMVSSLNPVTRFTICYANGSEDDGLSNSHAIRIPQFQFEEISGSISGKVVENVTNIPLSGSQVSLYDEVDQPVYNRYGVLMQVTTGSDGTYAFPGLVMGKYKIVQINPTGYNSVSDTDGTNDNIIRTTLDENTPHSYNNDFFEELNAPLPVIISDIRILPMKEQKFVLVWKTASEVNCHFYEVLISEDGIQYEALGQVISTNLSKNTYRFDFAAPGSGLYYIQLIQYDFDGKKMVAGILPLRISANEFKPVIFPNPASEMCTIHLNSSGEPYSFYTISQNTGKMISQGSILSNSEIINIDVRGLNSGFYVIKVGNNDIEHHIPLIIQK